MSLGIPRPEPRTLAFAGALLLSLAGAGLTLWGMPPTTATGRPGPGREAPVTATDVGTGRRSHSPTLASDPTDDRVAVVVHGVDGSSGGCGVALSGDGGDSWVPAAAAVGLPPDVDRCSEPDAAFDHRGRLHVLFTGLAANSDVPVGAYLAVSDDRGTSFGPPQRVLGPARGARLAVTAPAGGSSRIHLAWSAVEGGEILAAHSDDGGRTFSGPEPVSDPLRPPRSGPDLAVDPDGGVLVGFLAASDEASGRSAPGGPASGSGRWQVMTASTAGEDGFGAAVVVDDAVVPSRSTSGSPPAVAAAGGRTCLAWTDGRYGDPDVLLRCRREGAGWEPARRVNDDARGNGYWQYQPGLAMAANGRIDVAFYDRRNNLRNLLTGVAFAYSYDAERFSANVFMSRPPFDGGLLAGSAAVGPGVTLVAGPTSSLAAWADTRNASDAGLVADIYSARATLLFASRRPPWALPAGAAVAAAGAAGLWAFRRREPLP
ncbi:MAG: sialidase family protein [Acidimicrobiales bacterium]